MYIDIVVLFMTSDQIDSRDLWPKKVLFYLSLLPNMLSLKERRLQIGQAGTTQGVVVLRFEFVLEAAARLE